MSLEVTKSCSRLKAQLRRSSSSTASPNKLKTVTIPPRSNHVKHSRNVKPLVPRTVTLCDMRHIHMSSSALRSPVSATNSLNSLSLQSECDRVKQNHNWVLNEWHTTPAMPHSAAAQPKIDLFTGARHDNRAHVIMNVPRPLAMARRQSQGARVERQEAAVASS